MSCTVGAELGDGAGERSFIDSISIEKEFAMTIQKPIFLTSAIPYVNAEPHLGHALELVQSDALARYQRARGRDLRFTSGTDDNSLKNVRAADALGTTPGELVARYGAGFRRLAQALNVAHDDFIHTASDARHAPAVRRLVAALRGQRRRVPEVLPRTVLRRLRALPARVGDRRRQMSGAPRAARSARRRELVLSLVALRSGQFSARSTAISLRILPGERKHEVLQFIAGGLEDFSISRSRARAKGWGIPVPGDDTQIVYVWFDALANYLSVLGYPNGDSFRHFWQNAASAGTSSAKTSCAFTRCTGRGSC